MAQGNQGGSVGFWRSVRSDRLGLAIVGLAALLVCYRFLHGYAPTGEFVPAATDPVASAPRPGILSGLFTGIIGVVGPVALLIVVARFLWNVICGITLYLIGITIVIYAMYLMY